jgi:hypothetical protein
MNYERDITIDETALDVEWLEQAELAIKYGKHYIHCKDVLTRIEEELKVVRAELIQKANENPVKCCNKEKPNAADIEAYYRTHPKHKAVKEKWLDALNEFNMAEIVKNEISFTRKAALEALVQLHGQNYFAGPSVARNLQKEREKRIEKRKATNNRVRINKK